MASKRSSKATSKALSKMASISHSAPRVVSIGSMVLSMNQLQTTSFMQEDPIKDSESISFQHPPVVPKVVYTAGPAPAASTTASLTPPTAPIHVLGGGKSLKSMKDDYLVGALHLRPRTIFGPTSTIYVFDKFSRMLQHTGGHSSGTSTTITEIMQAYLGEEFVAMMKASANRARNDTTILKMILSEKLEFSDHALQMKLSNTKVLAFSMGKIPPASRITSGSARQLQAPVFDSNNTNNQSSSDDLDESDENNDPQFDSEAGAGQSDEEDNNSVEEQMPATRVTKRPLDTEEAATVALKMKKHSDGSHHCVKVTNFDDVSKDVLMTMISVFYCLIITQAPFPESIAVKTSLGKEAWNEASISN
ncbi:hypothetical protein BDR05DRAFT_951395 [Suillus weaverae]|nr:hypothetical protein BDR05DRAFT_951395 [Suillus weaverae]